MPPKEVATGILRFLANPAMASAARKHAQHINLTGAGLDCDKTKIFLEKLKSQNPPKTSYHLNLSNNNISTRGAEALAKFATEEKVKSLNLSQNNLSQQAAIVIAQALPDAKYLVSLNLSRNQIESAAAKQIAENVKNSIVQNIDLDYNKIQDEVAAKMAEMIAAKSKLQELTMRGNQLTSLSEGKFGEALARNTTMTKLLLGTLASEERRQYLGRNKQITDTLESWAKCSLGAKMANIVDSNSNFNPKDWSKDLISTARQILFSKKTPEEIIYFLNYWQAPFRQLRFGAMMDYGGMSWSPLFREKTLEIPQNIIGKTGFTITSITNPKELEEEGKHLQHCAAKFSHECLFEGYRMLSVRDENGTPISTMVFVALPTGRFFLQQHRATRNHGPNQDSQIAQDWFFAQIREGNITLDIESAMQDSLSCDETDSKIIGYLGFDPKNEEKTKQIRQEFVRTLAPREFGFKDATRELFSQAQIELNYCEINGADCLTFPQKELPQAVVKSPKNQNFDKKDEKDLS